MKFKPTSMKTKQTINAMICVILLTFLASCEIMPGYNIVQEFRGHEHVTYVWKDGDIIKSYYIDEDSISKETIFADSIKAVNFIDCIKNGRNCEVKKPKQNYKIEQGFLYGSFKTWIWYKSDLVMSYTIDNSEPTQSMITKDSLKAVKWIERTKKLKP